MFRECLKFKWEGPKYYKRKFTKTSEKARDPTVEALLEAHDPDGWKSQQPLSTL